MNWLERFGFSIMYQPVILLENNKYKIVRVLSWVINLTFWLPLLILGLWILFLSMIVEIYKEI